MARSSGFRRESRAAKAIRLSTQPEGTKFGPKSKLTMVNLAAPVIALVNCLWKHKGKVFVLMVILIWLVFVLVLWRNATRRESTKPITTTSSNIDDEIVESTTDPMENMTIFPLAPHHKNFIGYCTNEFCYKADRLFGQNVDQSIDPCDDFYKFACGKFHLRNPLKNKHLITETTKLHDKIEKVLLKRLLDTDREELTFIKSIRSFFLDCSQPEKLVHNELPLLQEVFHSIQNALSLEKLISITINNGIPSYLDIHVRTGTLKEANKLITFISVPHRPFDYLTEDRFPKYEEFIQKALKLAWPKVNNTRYALEARKIENTLFNCARANRRYSNREANSTVLNPSAVRTAYQINFGRVVNDTSFDNYLLAIRDGYFFNCMSREQLSSLRMHATWKAIQFYGPILSDEFVEIERDYLKQIKTPLEEENEEEEPVLEKICFNFIRDSLPLVVGRMFIDEFNFTESTKLAGQKLFYSVMDRLLSRGGMLEYGFPKFMAAELTKTSLKKFLKEMNSTNVQVAYPNWILSNSEMSKVFDLKNQSGNLFERALEIRKKIHHVEREKMKMNVSAWLKDGRFEWWPVWPYFINPFYSESHNLLTLPAGILMNVLFNVQAPSYFNYGSLAVLISRLIMSSIEPHERNFAKFFSQGSINFHFYAAKEMYDILDANNKPEEQTNLLINLTATLKQDIADHGGILLAFKAFQKVAGDKPELSFTHFADRKDSQMFFLSYANSLCSVVSKDEMTRRINNSYPYSPPKRRVNWPLAHSTHFTESFGCSSDKEMYAKPRVKFWSPVDQNNLQ